jgi:hypothetical protein
MKQRHSIAKGLVCLTFWVSWDGLAQAQQQTREEMQKALNAQVMASPFDPGDVKKAEAYAEEAKKQNIQPVATPPAYWVPGWTCGNMIGYGGYLYGDYRACVYYHHYYGRYWR